MTVIGLQVREERKMRLRSACRGLCWGGFSENAGFIRISPVHNFVLFPGKRVVASGSLRFLVLSMLREALTFDTDTQFKLWLPAKNQ